ncbi:NAD(P)H-dependent oxidoreductase [Saccharibacillus kuerlensis]|uniref:NAD(P)H oxidoreductase n=1 Tax=Saccharibacillus kuerlensis TaxID=459527 RepID=A0ABQ2KZJ0_9BACL|nr:NAD(P)H-dependent oxidoreductase [Saccharibacillus kuerlensis]GGN97945.1 NAD(P)H oxidoreductase [Saccharibacillus kuerlensis]
MKTLVIAAHPALESSRVNRTWLEELRKFPELITVSSLYEKYPDGTIDIAAEQALVEAHDRIILQFPFYWFSSPPMLKQWLDEVLLEGWAYGESIDLFHSKTIGVAISAGSRESEYQPEGRYRFDIHAMLSPFETTVHYLGAQYEPPFIQYGVNSRTSNEEIAYSTERYIRHLLQSREAVLPDFTAKY